MKRARGRLGIAHVFRNCAVLKRARSAEGETETRGNGKIGHSRAFGDVSGGELDFSAALNPAT